MRLIVSTCIALASTSSVAAAAPSVIGGYSATLDPSRRPESGQFGSWAAYAPGAWFVGGELAFGSPQVEHAEFAVSYHALAGVRAHVSPRIVVLADGGLGMSQQADWEWDLLGDGDMEMSTRSWSPSAAGRVHVAAEMFRIRSTHIGLALATDARTTLDDSAALALGVGLGLYLSN